MTSAPEKPFVAIDAMGGDYAPEAIVAGALDAAADGLPIRLVGRTEQLAPLTRGKVPIIHASEVIAMADGASAVRRKSDTSVRRTMDLVASGEACAAVSCGHTGAVLVAAVLTLGVVEGVERPAIATVVPRTDGGRLVLLDAGANVDCRPAQLASFALLGTAYAEMLGVKRPRVGLLSNGSEDGKGNEQVRLALPLLQDLPIHFVGNTEPTTALAGGADVLVCDGFVGNVLVKSLEGAVTTVVKLLGEEVRRRPSARFGAWLLSGAFGRFRGRVAWDSQGGAILLGTNGVVVVGHGCANSAAVRTAAHLAHRAATQGLIEGLRHRIQEPR